MNSGKILSKIITAELVAFSLMISFSACGKDNKASESKATLTETSLQPETISPEAAKQTDPETSTEGTTPSAQGKPEEAQNETGKDTEGETAVKTLALKIGDTMVAVDWEQNESVAALTELVKDEPMIIQMSMYGGFEQVGSIGKSLPRNDDQTTTQAGDIVLYSGNQIVVFYGSNSWSYTRLGHISDKSVSELEDLLGHENVNIEISME